MLQRFGSAIGSSRMQSTILSRSPTVACLIIGDEILNGKTLDTNSNYLAKKCFDSGLRLSRTVVIPDCKEDIVENAIELSKRYDFVFTSGGIGPTHDDITYEAMAQAFNIPLKMHDPTIDRMRRIGMQMMDHSKDSQPKQYEMNAARQRMAMLPYSSDKRISRVVFAAPMLWVPIVILNNNVHILPGIPKLFRDLTDYFFSETLLPSIPNTQKFIRKLVGTSAFESEIAESLTEFQAEADKHDIQIGSYPKWRPAGVSMDDWKLKVVVSVLGKDEKLVDEFAARIMAKIDGFPTQDS